MLNRSISVKQQCLKVFEFVPKLKSWYNIVKWFQVLPCAKELRVLNRIVSNSNTCNRFTACKQMINIHHHHVVPPAWISLILSRYFSQSFITSGRSSGLHPVSSHSCCMYVLAGRPAFARPYVGVHRSSSLLLQQCPVYLVRLAWIVFVMVGRWPYSWCLVGCCRQDLFNIARNILM